MLTPKRHAQIEDISHTVNISPTASTQNLNLQHLFQEILIVTFQWYFGHEWKFFCLVLGSSSKDKKSSRDKANLGHPKANSGCAPYTASHTSAQCVKTHQDPTALYRSTVFRHTGGLNFAGSLSGLASSRMQEAESCLRGLSSKPPPRPRRPRRSRKPRPHWNDIKIS